MRYGLEKLVKIDLSDKIHYSKNIITKLSDLFIIQKKMILPNNIKCYIIFNILYFS